MPTPSMPNEEEKLECSNRRKDTYENSIQKRNLILVMTGKGEVVKPNQRYRSQRTNLLYMGFSLKMISIIYFMDNFIQKVKG